MKLGSPTRLIHITSRLCVHLLMPCVCHFTSCDIFNRAVVFWESIYIYILVYAIVDTFLDILLCLITFTVVNMELTLYLYINKRSR